MNFKYEKIHLNMIPNKITEQDKPNKKEDKINLILEFCKEPKSVKEIMEYIGLKHRPTFMYDYLNPLLEKDKLQMTIPDKPKSKTNKSIVFYREINYNRNILLQRKSLERRNLR